MTWTSKDGLEGYGELLKASDELIERHLRRQDASNLNNHIGQAQFKKLAEIHVSSPAGFPHTILTGNPGLGKTYLAKMLAKRLGGRFRYFIGTDLNPETVHQIISETKHGDVVFIDEIHSIHREGAEIFYDVLQDFLYRGEPVPRFTMIGATTDIAKVPKPLRDRCWSQSMEYYSVDELVKIVCQHYPELGKEAALECAKRAHGVPRMALKKLAMHVDAARGRMTPHEVFKTLGVDETGLMAEHRKILSVLKASSLPAARSGATKPVGLEELVFRVDAPRDEVLMYESQLLRLGLVTRTHRGREITTAGIHYCTLGGEGMTDAETQPRGEGEH